MRQPPSQTQNALLAGPVRPALLRFAGPVILSMVATQLYTVVDTMIIGLCLDAGALAAVSNASTVLLAFLFVSGGMELGGGLLRLIQTPAEIQPQAMAYARFYLIGLPFLMVYDLSKQLAMACGDSRTPLLAVLATSLLNVVLDLVLVGPFGVAGAAAATSFSQAAGCLFMLGYLRCGLLTGPFRLSELKRQYVWDVFRLSAPNAVQQASAPVSSMVKQGLLGGIGVTAIAGFSCASKLHSLLLMPVAGLVQALVFFVAQNTAARQLDRVREGARQTRSILLAYALLVTAGCVLFAGPLLRLFTADGGAIRYGALLLSRQALVFAFTAMRHLQEASLRGRQRMGLYLASNIGSTLIDLTACVLLVPWLGYDGFYLAAFVSAPAGLALAYGLARLGAARAADPS